MSTRQAVLQRAQQSGIIRTRHITSDFDVSRQYAAQLMRELIEAGHLIKVGSTRSAAYVTPMYYAAHPELHEEARYLKVWKREGLEEHVVLEDLERVFIPYRQLPENIKSIFDYAFLEMINNAIDHSQTDKIRILVEIEDDVVRFVVRDFGIGVYRNIMQERNLDSELEAIQDLLKGKMTTAPSLHSGEGIFFTSKAGDRYTLDSFGMKFIADNTIDDIFVGPSDDEITGTQVRFELSTTATHHLSDIFAEYTIDNEDDGAGFDKTEIRIRLYTLGGVHISRSQARRVLDGLDKFRVVVMDYDQVPMVGQAFADEIYRVFQARHPEIEILNENMTPSVAFMVERAQREAEVGRG